MLILDKVFVRYKKATNKNLLKTNMFSICFIVFVLSLFDGVFGQAVYSARTGAAKTTISAGEDVTIDENIELSSQLTIEGVLRCAKKHLSVVVPRIIIKGNGKFIVKGFSF